MKVNKFNSLKKSLLLAAIVGFMFNPVFSQVLPLFSVSQNDLSKKEVLQLKAKVKKMEGSSLLLAKNNRDNDVYPVTFSSGGNTKIIILNEETGANVVVTPVSETLTEFQLSPFFIEELRRGALGDAEHYLVIEATSNNSVKNLTSVSCSNGEVYIPRYFYGEKENVQEALPKDRQITSISKSKPQLISAFPDDPEVQQRIALLEEARSYYVYVFKLPDGTKCTYSEILNPDGEQQEMKPLQDSGDDDANQPRLRIMPR
jgi:hypothetical protein